MKRPRISWARRPLPVCVTAIAILLSCAISPAQENLSFRIDDEITRFAFSGDGRIAYATQHVFSEKKIRLQRDDIWIADRDGKKRRIFQGDKFVRGSNPFSYLVRGVRWSPDNTKLAVELATSEMINENGDTKEGAATLLLDQEGKEIPAAVGDSVIPGAMNAAWLPGGTTILYLTASQPAAPPPSSGQPPKKNAQDTPPAEPSYVVNRIRAESGPGSAVFSGQQFAAVTWNPSKNLGVAVQRAASEAASKNAPAVPGPAELVAFDLEKETRRDLTKIDAYAGGLSLSPSGDKVAYWVGNEQLEVREVNAPGHVVRLRVVLGTLAWSADEKRVLVKQGPAGKSGGLVWLNLPQLGNVAAGSTVPMQQIPLQSTLHDLEFRQFEISPDGKLLGVIEPGRRNLLVYSLP